MANVLFWITVSVTATGPNNPMRSLGLLLLCDWILQEHRPLRDWCDKFHPSTSNGPETPVLHSFQRLQTYTLHTVHQNFLASVITFTVKHEK